MTVSQKQIFDNMTNLQAEFRNEKQQFVTTFQKFEKLLNNPIIYSKHIERNGEVLLNVTDTDIWKSITYPNEFLKLGSKIERYNVQKNIWCGWDYRSPTLFPQMKKIVDETYNDIRFLEYRLYFNFDFTEPEKVFNEIKYLQKSSLHKLDGNFYIEDPDTFFEFLHTAHCVASLAQVEFWTEPNIQPGLTGNNIYIENEAFLFPGEYQNITIKNSKSIILKPSSNVSIVDSEYLQVEGTNIQIENTKNLIFKNPNHNIHIHDTDFGFLDNNRDCIIRANKVFLTNTYKNHVINTTYINSKGFNVYSNGNKSLIVESGSQYKQISNNQSIVYLPMDSNLTCPSSMKIFHQVYPFKKLEFVHGSLYVIYQRGHYNGIFDLRDINFSLPQHKVLQLDRMYGNLLLDEETLIQKEWDVLPEIQYGDSYLQTTSRIYNIIVDENGVTTEEPIVGDILHVQFLLQTPMITQFCINGQQTHVDSATIINTDFDTLTVHDIFTENITINSNRELEVMCENQIFSQSIYFNSNVNFRINSSQLLTIHKLMNLQFLVSNLHTYEFKYRDSAHYGGMFMFQSFNNIYNQHITQIPAYTFYKTTFKDIQFLNTEVIGEYAFYQTTPVDSLIRLQLPKVRLIKEYAFYGLGLYSMQRNEKQKTFISTGAFLKTNIRNVNLINTQCDRDCFDSRILQVFVSNSMGLGSPFNRCGQVYVYNIDTFNKYLYKFPSSKTIRMDNDCVVMTKDGTIYNTIQPQDNQIVMLKTKNNVIIVGNITSIYIQSPLINVDANLQGASFVTINNTNELVIDMPIHLNVRLYTQTLEVPTQSLAYMVKYGATFIPGNSALVCMNTSYSTNFMYAQFIVYDAQITTSQSKSTQPFTIVYCEPQYVEEVEQKKYLFNTQQERVVVQSTP